jgi:uncharacterized SAM-binding protein YcdF (DUF218 family)
MFFAASKILWSLAQPSHIIVFCGIVAALLLISGRRRAGTAFTMTTALLLIGTGVIPSYNWLGRRLEDRYADQPLPLHADGVLMLGGGAENIHRVSTSYILARRYPDAKIVFSGGSGDLIDNKPGIESQEAKAFLLALGLNPERLILEGRSRNTYENFVNSKNLVKPQSGQTWILVTSAYHMPRAMEIANRVHWKVIPYQSNRLTGRYRLIGWFDVPNNLLYFDMLFREQIGLIAYRWSGRSQH